MKTIAVLAFLMPLALHPAHAVEDSVPFGAVLSPECQITIGDTGTMTSNVGFTELSSNGPGGAPGTATIITTAPSFNVSATAPAVFTQTPPGGGDNVTFASTYSAGGVTTLTDVEGSTISPLGQGQSDISVDLTATKSAGNFSQGIYVAEVTLTCE